MAPYARCSDVPFDNVVRFLECFERVKKSAAKGKQLENFRVHNVVRPSDDIFQIYRLLLPGVRGGAGEGAGGPGGARSAHEALCWPAEPNSLTPRLPLLIPPPSPGDPYPSPPCSTRTGACTS
jgi:hypothetical protein